jgi:hypothetical protein
MLGTSKLFFGSLTANGGTDSVKRGLHQARLKKIHTGAVCNDVVPDAAERGPREADLVENDRSRERTVLPTTKIAPCVVKSFEAQRMRVWDELMRSAH